MIPNSLNTLDMQVTVRRTCHKQPRREPLFKPATHLIPNTFEPIPRRRDPPVVDKKHSRRPSRLKRKRRGQNSFPCSGLFKSVSELTYFPFPHTAQVSKRVCVQDGVVSMRATACTSGESRHPFKFRPVKAGLLVVVSRRLESMMDSGLCPRSVRLEFP